MLAVEVAGGRQMGDNLFRMEIVGADGTLTLTGGAPQGFQAGVLSLCVNGDLVRGEDTLPALSDSATNVAHVYAALRADIVHGTAPTFSHAVQLSHLIDDLLTADREQRTVTPGLPSRADSHRFHRHPRENHRGGGVVGRRLAGDGSE